MIATLTACALGASTLYCLGGWCVSESRRFDAERQVEAYQAEDWHTSDDMAEFAGRCAWHDYVSTDELPPMVQDHHADAFRAGFAAEQAVEDRICAGLAARLRDRIEMPSAGVGR